MEQNKTLYAHIREQVMAECKAALERIDPEQTDRYLEMITSAEKVFFVGVGRVLLSLKCIAKRYAHLGIRAVVVGDITEPAITEKDVLVVGSGSGETLFPVGIARKARQIGAKIIHIGSNPVSSLTPIEDLFVRIPVESRAKAPDEIRSVQPMTTLFEQAVLLFGDITALMLIRQKQLDLNALWNYHANLE